MKKEQTTHFRSSRALHVLDVFGTVGRALLEEQSKSWMDVWERMLDGKYEPKELLRDATQIWAKSMEGMVELVAAPANVLQGSAMQIPQAVFVIDDEAQCALPVVVHSPIVLQEKSDTTVCTALERTDGAKPKLDAEHVLVHISPSGHQLSIELQNLKSHVQVGQYGGVVYLGGRGAPGRPLATVQLFVVPHA